MLEEVRSHGETTFGRPWTEILKVKWITVGAPVPDALILGGDGNEGDTLRLALAGQLEGKKELSRKSFLLSKYLRRLVLKMRSCTRVE